MTTVFDYLAESSDPVTRAWAKEYKLKTGVISLHEMMDLSIAIQREWPAFDRQHGILQSRGRVLVYTPMRLRTFLAPFLFLVVRYKMNEVISKFNEQHCLEVRSALKVKHCFFLPRSFTLPMKNTLDIDLSKLSQEMEKVTAPVPFSSRVGSILRKIKQAI